MPTRPSDIWMEVRLTVKRSLCPSLAVATQFQDSALVARTAMGHGESHHLDDKFVQDYNLKTCIIK